jgi:hypothetical protein
MNTFKLSSLSKRIVPDMGRFLSYQLLNDDVYFAGGALRTLIDKDDKLIDFDLFFKSRDALNNTAKQLENLDAKNIYKCPEDKLFTYKLDELKIQLIAEDFYVNVDNLLSSFDINACRACIHKDYLYIDNVTIKDIKKKRITLHQVDYHVATFNRMLKYKNKGYYLPNETIKMFVEDCWKRGFGNIPLDTRVYID